MADISFGSCLYICDFGIRVADLYDDEYPAAVDAGFLFLHHNVLLQIDLKYQN